MRKITLMIGLCLTFFTISPLLAGTDAVGQADANRTSTIQIYASAGGTTEIIGCTEPRPQVCSQEYRPVCAELQDGSFKTFANGCSACSDPAVTGYREGACE